MLINKQEIQKLDYEPNSFEEHAIKYLLNNSSTNLLQKHSIMFTTYMRKLEEAYIDSQDFYYSCQDILKTCNDTYIKAIDYIIENFNMKNELSMKELKFIANAKDFKDTYNQLSYNFDLLSWCYGDGFEFDLDKIGQGFLKNLIDLSLTLQSMEFSTDEYLNKIEVFAHSIEDIGNEIKLHTISNFGYFVHRNFNQGIASMCIGSEFMKDISRLVKEHLLETDAPVSVIKDYRIESLYSMHISFDFSDSDKEHEFEIFDI